VVKGVGRLIGPAIQIAVEGRELIAVADLGREMIGTDRRRPATGDMGVAAVVAATMEGQDGAAAIEESFAIVAAAVADIHPTMDPAGVATATMAAAITAPVDIVAAAGTRDRRAVVAVAV
jgi:hypothetical protein